MSMNSLNALSKKKKNVFFQRGQSSKNGGSSKNKNNKSTNMNMILFGRGLNDRERHG